jgi:hypothetical protein
VVKPVQAKQVYHQFQRVALGTLDLREGEKEGGNCQLLSGAAILGPVKLFVVDNSPRYALNPRVVKQDSGGRAIA